MSYIVRPATQAQPLDIVMQPDSSDPNALSVILFGLHYLETGTPGKYSHCGIFIGGSPATDGHQGQMIAAQYPQGVIWQDAGAVGSIAVAYPWKDPQTTEAWVRAQLGKPYDTQGLAIAAIAHLLAPGASAPITKAFTCSSLVAAAIWADAQAEGGNTLHLPKVLGERVVTPDDIGAYLGVGS